MFKQLLISAAICTGGFASTSSCFIARSQADEPSFPIDAEIQQARSELAPDQLPDLADTEALVLSAMADVEAYLQRRATQDNAAAWRRFLDLGPLTDAIQKEESTAQRGRAAVELESRMRDIFPGLELKAMTALRTAVQRYIAALRYSDPDRGIASVQKQLDALATILSVAGEDGEAERQPRGLESLSPDEVAQVDQLLIGFADANQAAPLIRKIQSYYSHENIRGWVDGQALAEAISRPVHNPSAVNDCILGTRVIGQAWVDGKVTGHLLPSDGYVRLLIRLDGSFSTVARGYHKPITLDTSGTGRVYAARQLAITEKGIVLGETVSSADLSTQINRINHPLRIVRRLASKQAAEQRPLAEAISREKLRTQVQQQFDSQTAAIASRSFPSLDGLVDPWRQRLDLPSLTRSIGSTSDAIYVRSNLQRKYGLAAPGEPPPLAMLSSHDDASVVPGNYLAAVQVHQSVVDNSIAPLLAGQNFTPHRILQLARALNIDLSNRDSVADAIVTGVIAVAATVKDAAAGDSEEEDYEVDLASFRPVFVEADNQELRVGLRGTRFSQGGRELDQALEVSAVYRPVRSDDGSVWLRRDEEVQLSFPGNRRLSISQTAIKTNMQKSFNELFPTELLHRRLAIPQDGEIRALAGRVIQISAIDLTDGWISIAIR